MKAVKNNPVNTVLTISVGFGIIYLVSDFRWTLYLSLIVGVLGITSTKITKEIDFLWMKLAKVLSYIIPNILLTIIFYLFLFPMSVLAKIFGNKDALQLKEKSDTLWIHTDTQCDKNTFEKMW